MAVGKELLIGRTMNSNAFWIGKRLARMGSMLAEITTVDDDLGEIGRSFEAIIQRSPDYLVVVGGLGPTPDDMTLKGIAGAMGVRMFRSHEALEMIRKHYAERGLGVIELTHSRAKMAILPVGAMPLTNEVGTAPGVRLVVRDTTAFCLPGVPAEMRSIFRKSVEPEIRAKLGKMFRKYVTMNLEGVLESSLAPVLAKELRKHPGAYIKSHPRGIRGGVSKIELDIAVVSGRKELADEVGKKIADEMRKEVVDMGGSVGSARRWVT